MHEIGCARLQNTELMNNKMKREEKREKKKMKAFGLIDSIINKMPEIHIPSYQYTGPGTKLEKRLARGDPGKNKLDVACKDHDIAYAACEDSKSRRKADKILIERAFKRIYSRDAKLGERAVALLVSGLMSAKVGLTKIGLGLGGGKNRHKKMKSRVNRSKKRNSIAFSELIRGAKDGIKKVKLNDRNYSSLNKTVKAAIRSAKDMKRGKTVKIPRVLKLPKFGGNLQALLPILSGLSAIGSITSSAVGVVKAMKDIKNAKHLMEKNQRQYTSGQQNMSREKKIGRALNLIHKTSKNARGSGFYLKPHHQHR